MGVDGGLPPGGAPPAAAKKKGGSTGIIVGALAGVAVIGGGVAAYMMFSGGGDPFPCPIQNLPEDTVSVAHFSFDERLAANLGVAPGDVPDEARWSAMADDFCGGSDLYDTLMGADHQGVDTFAAETIAKAIEDKKDVQKQLECGKEVAKSFKGHAYQVQFGTKKKRGVVVFLSGMETLPESDKKLGKWKGKGALIESGCFLTGEKEDCDEESSRGIARIENTNMWAMGSLDALEAFGEDFEERDKLSKEAEKLADVASKVKKHNQTAVGAMETMQTEFGGLVGARLTSEKCGEDKDAEEKEEDPEKREKQRKAIKEIEPYWGYGSSVKAGEGTFEVVYRTEKEEDATELFDFIESQLKSEKAKIKTTKTCEKEREEKEKEAASGEEGEKKNQPKKSVKAFRDAQKDVARRALETGVVEQDGEWVTVTFTLEPEDAEKTAIDEYMNEQKEKLESVSKVIEAFLNGEKPEKDLLKTLGGGSEFVDAMDKASEALAEKKAE